MTTIMMKNAMANNTMTNEAKERSFEDLLFDLVEGNKQTIGRKTYALIPLGLLEIDDRYQRVCTYSESKVRSLAANFDINKMDPLVVSVRPEEKRYYVINGMHRLFAAKILGMEKLECIIIEFPGTPEERLKAEARYFISQFIEVDPMKPIDQHKGHVVCGDREFVELDEVVRNTNGIRFNERDENGRMPKGRLPKGTLTGYVEARDRTRWYGKQHIQNVFDILIAAKWNEVGKGLGQDAIRMVSTVLHAHNDREDVKKEIARVLTNHMFSHFDCRAYCEYGDRTRDIGMALVLEDHVCTNLNIPRLIDPEIKRYKPAPETVA